MFVIAADVSVVFVEENTVNMYNLFEIVLLGEYEKGVLR